MLTMDSQVTDHFKLSKCLCACCDRIKIVPGFFSHMELLEAMRVDLGFPINIDSGYRCHEHNEESGGAPKSWHMLFATDVRPNWGRGYQHRLLAMYKAALSQNWGGIIYHQSFIHLDRRSVIYRLIQRV